MDKRITRIMLAVGITFNKKGGALYGATAVIFQSQTYGVLSIGELLAVFITVTLASTITLDIL